MDSDKKNKRTEIFKKVVECVRADLNIIDVREKTHIYVVAVDRQTERNKCIALPCEGCQCISGYAYDGKNDCVLLNGANHIDLGSVDYGIQIMLENTGSWRNYIPLSVSAIERVLSAQQAKCLAEFRQRFAAPQYDIHFVQMTSCR